MKLAVAALPFLTLGAACGSSPHPDYSLIVGEDDGGGHFEVTDASGGPALDALIERDGLGGELVTLSCSGGCAMVQAVGIGAHPPYKYRWEDGATTPVRKLCPSRDTSYSV